MRARIVATASVLALLAGPVAFTAAQAQTQAPPSSHPPATSPSAPTATAPRTPMPDPMAQEDVSEVKGSAVYGSDDKKIGSVSTVLMDPKSKTVDRLVVSEGGVLGVGSHRVALPVDAFKWDGEKDGFKIAKTADDLKKMPEWKSASTASAAPSGGSGTMPSSGSSQPPSAARPPGAGTAGPGTSGTGTSGTGSTQ